MNRAALISVIVPVYNGANYLAEALESAQQQTYAPLELIVIDDGSTDASFEMAGRLAAVRRVQQAHSGISAARNRGIELARGDFFAFLDADDVWLAEKLTLQMRALEANPDLGMVFGHVQEFLSPELPAEIANTLRCEPESKPGVIPSTLLVRREAFQRIGAFETQWDVGEFASWMLHASEARVAWSILPDLVARRRIHTANNGIRQRHAFNQYARLIKASLDRRRAAEK
ncbi:MAG TPA: glycosyltransferase family A protein [Anaerolineae bacterium]|nr:glycosyltransferase family A protein [Anaerolineae bacterium]